MRFDAGQVAEKDRSQGKKMEAKECAGLEASENHYKSLQKVDKFEHNGNFNWGAVLAFDNGI
jgi:hypothetical protein